MIELNYDGVGRKTQCCVTTLGTNFDGTVRRISTTYNTLKLQQLVTQYDNATVGSGSVVNEIRNTYSGWGTVTAYEEDPDSAVDASGSVNQYKVAYTYEKNTTGRQAIRRKRAELSVGTGASLKAFTYTFGSNYDNDASRVSAVKNGNGSSTFAEYEYLGTGFVV